MKRKRKKKKKKINFPVRESNPALPGGGFVMKAGYVTDTPTGTKSLTSQTFLTL